MRPSWVLLAALAFLLAVVAALAAATPAPGLIGVARAWLLR